MPILQILSLDDAHGCEIAQSLRQVSRAVGQINQSSLHPAAVERASCARLPDAINFILEEGSR